MLVAYFGIGYILMMFAAWALFAVGCGAITWWLARRLRFPNAVSFRCGVLAGMAGAFSFPYIFAGFA
jgi:hypothetical protein